jgi:hypothetical protein
MRLRARFRYTRSLSSLSSLKHNFTTNTPGRRSTALFLENINSPRKVELFHSILTSFRYDDCVKLKKYEPKILEQKHSRHVTSPVIMTLFRCQCAAARCLVKVRPCSLLVTPILTPVMCAAHTSLTQQVTAAAATATPATSPSPPSTSLLLQPARPAAAILLR